uniref:Uncharacterized protein n=1 Tax=Fagus sylvatica TaxID=28930 RepID=A0A2N9FR60_FAGSY
MWLVMGPIPLSRDGVLLVCGGRWWGFVEVVVGFCWLPVGLAECQDVVAGGCVAVTVGFAGEWWLVVVAGGCAIGGCG